MWWRVWFCWQAPVSYSLLSSVDRDVSWCHHCIVSLFMWCLEFSWDKPSQTHSANVLRSNSLFLFQSYKKAVQDKCLIYFWFYCCCYVSYWPNLVPGMQPSLSLSIPWCLKQFPPLKGRITCSTYVVLLSGSSITLYSHPVQCKFCVLFQLKQITWDSFLASIQITPNGLTPVCCEEPNCHEAIVIY